RSPGGLRPPRALHEDLSFRRRRRAFRRRRDRRRVGGGGDIDEPDRDRRLRTERPQSRRSSRPAAGSLVGRGPAVARGDVGRFAVNAAVRWFAVTVALGWSSALLWGRWLAEFGWLPTSVALATATLSVLAVWSLTVWFTVDTLLAAVERALAGSARAGGRLADHLRSEGGRWMAGGVD